MICFHDLKSGMLVPLDGLWPIDPINYTCNWMILGRETNQFYVLLTFHMNHSFFDETFSKDHIQEKCELIEIVTF